ncbi:hypothetical protein J6590_082066 [Homalodisca vitripennis]|nr:hypothetical protein J6590_082066 [Homalodisca vitripennis]
MVVSISIVFLKRGTNKNGQPTSTKCYKDNGDDAGALLPPLLPEVTRGESEPWVGDLGIPHRQSLFHKQWLLPLRLANLPLILGVIIICRSLGRFPATPLSPFTEIYSNFHVHESVRALSTVREVASELTSLPKHSKPEVKYSQSLRSVGMISLALSMTSYTRPPPGWRKLDNETHLPSSRSPPVACPVSKDNNNPRLLLECVAHSDVPVPTGL